MAFDTGRCRLCGARYPVDTSLLSHSTSHP